ncbi:MAG TPA: fumarylacetoacetate hydrolase family protein [Bryobacteraceae bacterium]|jgi:2-keto-4-pentenoate hydratase/2-oxohepta-3-ene-1,7-dioic acid hydratase in catechol pathway|nr:fumarylacetoacetate hydrolase family protein [Bryobacteraceae bacterium]
MRFVTFEQSARRQAGIILRDQILSLESAGFPDVLSILQGGTEALGKVESFAAGASAGIDLASVKLCAPIPIPPKILCMGLNYRDHAEEAKLEIPKFPVIFAKYTNTVIGHGDKIVLPKNSRKPDYEAEFGFVIGKRARHIKAEDWRNYVFGYMNCNDVSARDVQVAVSQWTMGKNFDTFAPMGPYLVSADEIADPHNLDISLTLNGQTMQSSNTRELIFKIPETIEFLSSIMTLEPGDIVMTGTPAGVGFGRKPPHWLAPGDEVVVRVAGLGELRNTCVAEA